MTEEYEFNAVYIRKMASRYVFHKRSASEDELLKKYNEFLGDRLQIGLPITYAALGLMTYGNPIGIESAIKNSPGPTASGIVSYIARDGVLYLLSASIEYVHALNSNKRQEVLEWYHANKDKLVWDEAVGKFVLEGDDASYL